MNIYSTPKSLSFGLSGFAYFRTGLTESGCDWQSSHSWQHGQLVHEFHTTYFSSSPLTCPQCQADYFSEIDLDGDITYYHCFQCGWDK